MNQRPGIPGLFYGKEEEMSSKILEGGLLSGRKTYLAAAGVVISAVIAYLVGDAGLMDTLTTVGEALGIGFLRAGVAKSAIPQS